MARVMLRKLVAVHDFEFGETVALKSFDRNTLCYVCNRFFEWEQLKESNKVSDVWGAYITLCGGCLENTSFDGDNWKLSSKLIDLNEIEEELESRKHEKGKLEREIARAQRRLKNFSKEVEFRVSFSRILFLSTASFFAYAVFHGYRLGIDCWLCRYRGFSVIVLFLLFVGGDEVIELIESGVCLLLGEGEDKNSEQSSESSETESKSDDEEPKSDDPPKSEDPRVNFARNLEKKDEKK